MVIRRNTKEYGLPEGVIEIELTAEELEKAFREQEHKYRLEDAETALHNAYESEQISEETYEAIKDNEKFHEAVLVEFDKRFSCNIPENTIWEMAWKEVIKEVDRYVG